MRALLPNNYGTFDNDVGALQHWKKKNRSLLDHQKYPSGASTRKMTPHTLHCQMRRKYSKIKPMS